MGLTINKDLREKLERFSNLPSIPQNIAKIQQISGNPKASVADLANSIITDHQLTSRILRMANSSYYGDYTRKVTTVTHAIMMMGFRTVRNIAVSMSVYGMVNKLSKNSKFDLVSFWTRSLACGLICKFLATRIGKPELAETAFIAGFMHDIGQIILAGVFPDKYEKISKQEAEAADVYRTEDFLLEVNHLEIGGYVARNWNLPDALVKAMTDHHRVGKPPDVRSDELMTDLVYIADRIFPHMMSGESPDAKSYRALIRQAETLIGIPAEGMVEVLRVSREQIESIARDLEIDIEREFEARAIREHEDADVHEQLAHKEAQLSFLQNITTALMEAKKVDEILQVLCETMFRGLQLGRVIAMEHDRKADQFKGAVGFGIDSQNSIVSLAYSAASGVLQQVRESRQAVVVPFGKADETMRLEPAGNTTDDALFDGAFAVIPVDILDDAKYVVVAACPNRSHSLSEEAMRSLVSMASQASLCIERRLLRGRVTR